jgi:SSS family solute:Na+ symporter
MLLMIVISLADRSRKDAHKALVIDTKMFKASPGFIVGSVIIVGILAALYTVFY